MFHTVINHMQRCWRLAIVVICVLALLLGGGELAARVWWPSLPVPGVTRAQKVGLVPTHTPAQSGDSGDGEWEQERRLQRDYAGANGWIWRAQLPYERLVVFYGDPDSAAMGPIGQYTDTELITKLRAQAQVYADLDPSHPVMPALDYVTPVVQPVPMDDHTWVYRMPDASIQRYITLSNSNHALFFFDMQVGHSSVQKEVSHVWSYLQQPGVELSLDPEFDLSPGEIPDVEFGQMHASEINWTIDRLSNLVQTRHLPPKILIIHRFLQEMLPDWQAIHLKPGVQVIITVDGFGTPQEKVGDYQVYDNQDLLPGEFAGMKLFYKLDTPLMAPSDVLALKPAPLMVMYQ